MGSRNQLGTSLLFALSVASCAVSTADGAPEGDATEAEDQARLDKFLNPGGKVDLEIDETDLTASCDAGQAIYLLTDENLLLRFSPSTLELTELGTVNCATDADINSMAIDREGNAWFGFNGGAITKVSTKTLACEETGYETGQLSWIHFGMAFVSESEDSTKEALYLSDSGTDLGFFGLGRVEPDSLELRAIGPFDGALQDAECELTGLRDGRIFAFCPGDESYLAEVDRLSGVTISAERLPFSDALAFAFAHWGGRFFLFTSIAEGVGRIDRYTPGFGTERLRDDLPYQILGAGVSTCAPTETVVR